MSTCKDCSGKGGMVSAAAGMPISVGEYVGLGTRGERSPAGGLAETDGNPMNTDPRTNEELRAGVGRRGKCVEGGGHIGGYTQFHQDHPEADVVRWNQSMRVAYHLICYWAQLGLDLDRQVEECDPSDVLGTSRGDLAWALVLARRWQRREFEEFLGAPAPLKGAKLYG